MIKLVVGLGNPGKKYDGTRHNIGRRLVESLRASPIAVSWLVTDSYMNESGIEVARASKYKNIASEEVLVVLDEFQLPLRKVSILYKGSDGGHNGLKSVLEHLGTQNVPRLRIGIGPLPEHDDPANFVLERFSNAERPVLEQLMPKFEEAIALSVEKGLDAAMNKYNGILLA